MPVRRSAIAACGSGMDSASMGIFFFDAGLLTESVQAALEASATPDGQIFHSRRSDSFELRE